VRVSPATEAGQCPLRQLMPSTSHRRPRCHPLNPGVQHWNRARCFSAVQATDRRLEIAAPSTESRGPEVTELRTVIQHVSVLGELAGPSAQSSQRMSTWREAW